MKTSLISLAVTAALAAWVPTSLAREAVALPGVVGTEGVLNGVDTAGAGTLSIGNQNINTNNDLGGAITSTAADTAIAAFSGSSTVTGFTGTTGSQLLRIDAGAVGSTVNFNGAVFSNTFRVTGTGVVNFNGNVRAAPEFSADGFINLGLGRTLTGAITTLTANTGTLTLNGGSNVVGAIGGANGLKQINVAGGNAAITGAVQTRGFDLGANTLTITGALTTNPGGTIATTLASNSVFGHIVASTSLVNAAGITVIPTVTGVLTSGTNFRIIDAPAGTNAAPVLVVNNNPRFTFSGVPTTTGDVNIVLSGVMPLAAFTTNSGANAVAPILDVNAAIGSDLLAIQNAIAVLPNAASINNALTQLAPGSTNLAAPWVAGQATRLFEDLWMARVDEIQDQCCDTCEPKDAGAPTNSHKCKSSEQRSNWWGKGFGSRGRQGDTNNLNGFRSKALGLMLAYDMPLSNQTRIGVGAGYANTDIDGNNSSGRTEIDSYQLTAYVHHATGPVFIQGALTAGIDNYSGSRPIVFTGVNRTANADYRGQQYTALVTAGKHFSFNETTITPLASLQVSRVNVNGYTENGAGDANLRIQRQSYDYVQSSLGVKAERRIQSGAKTFAPEVHIKWQHDFESTTTQQNASFTGSTAVFTVNGIKQDRDLFNVGAGITFLSCNCGEEAWTVKGIYDYKWNKSNYSSNQLSIIASRKF